MINRKAYSRSIGFLFLLIRKLMLERIQSIPGWLTDNEALELQRLAKDRTVLEAGSYCGRSSAAMGLVAKKLVCVDPFDGRGTSDVKPTLERFRQTLRDFNLYDKVSYFPATIEEWSEVCVPQKFDLIFVDTEHTRRCLMSNMTALHPFCSERGIIAFHDYSNRDFPEMPIGIYDIFHREPDNLVDSLAIYKMSGPIAGRHLHVVTPCVRVDNLAAISVGIEMLRQKMRGWTVDWHIVLDLKVDYCPDVKGAKIYRVYKRHDIDRKGFGLGSPGRNLAIDRIEDGWIWFMDDDNWPHPTFADGFTKAVNENPGVNGIVFKQVFKNEDVRLEAPAQIELGTVDTGMYVFKRRAIGNIRWSHKKGNDMEFYRDVVQSTGKPIVAEGAVYYNKLD